MEDASVLPIERVAFRVTAGRIRRIWRDTRFADGRGIKAPIFAPLADGKIAIKGGDAGFHATRTSVIFPSGKSRLQSQEAIRPSEMSFCPLLLPGDLRDDAALPETTGVNMIVNCLKSRTSGRKDVADPPFCRVARSEKQEAERVNRMIPFDFDTN
ncbi:MAG: hypothetical protein ACREFE_17245 [Limisphaerales bacterium]